MSIDISFNEADIRRISAKFKDIGSKKQQSAMASAINKVARAYRRDMIKRIKNRYTVKGISAGDKTAPLKRASPSDLKATVTFPWGEKSTRLFKVKGSGKTTPARVAITTGAYKTLASSIGAKGFTLKADSYGKFQNKEGKGLQPFTIMYRVPRRRGKRKHTLSPTFGPSLRGMAHAEPVLEAALNTAQKDLVEKLDETVKKWL